MSVTAIPQPKPKPVSLPSVSEREPCQVSIQDNGDAVVTIHVPAAWMARVKTRAGAKELGLFMYDEYYKRAVYSRIY